MRRALPLDDLPVVADEWPGDGPTVALLHAGVADRRSWYGTAELLAGDHHVIAADRRGYGDSPVSTTPFTHVEDLLALLDRAGGDGPAWLVGSSMGGQVALDTAVLHPDRVAGLVLVAPAVSGAPEPETLDPVTQRLGDLLGPASAAGDLEEVGRLETWLWLDGPAGPEGRVTGAARELAREMNATVLRNGLPEGDGGAGISAWERLSEVAVPVTVAWGDLDVPFLLDQCEQLAGLLPRATRRVLPGVAHLPYLEDPALVADVVRSAVAGR
jgi:pimeloyl-ACP methyl ester carboxylesterase